MVELYLFGYQQEPCRINVDELKADYEAARSEIEVSLAAEDPERLRVLLSQMEREYNDILVYRNKGGSRGLGSERASQRQIVGSENPRIKEVVGMDDALDKGLPVIPDWTPTLKLAVQSSLENMFEDAERRRSSARPNRLTTTALVDRSPVKTPCSNRSRATEDLTDIKTPNVSPTKSPQLRRSCSTSDLTQQYTIKSGLKKFLESDEDDLTDDDSASKSSNL